MVTQFNELTDFQWQIISPCLNIQRKRKTSLRSITNAVLYMVRNGGKWRNLRLYPDLKWSTVYYYFYKWRNDGTVESINLLLNRYIRKASGREEDPSLFCADSQSVKLAPMIGTERGFDGNKKINGRKRQVLTDSGGLVWACFVHAANGHDSIMGCELLERITGLSERFEKVLVDAGYKGEFVKKAEKDHSVKAEISSKPPTEKGFVPVKQRWVIERTFAWFNFYERLDKDRERTTLSAETMIFLANISIVLNRIGLKSIT
jgi:transposase